MIKIIIWGTGVKAAEYMQYYAEPMKNFAQVVCFIDNNPVKRAQDFFGYDVVAYEEVASWECDYIVIMNNFETEIRKQVQVKGVDKKIISMYDFFSMYEAMSPWSDKNVLYVGEQTTYEDVKHHSKYMFKNVVYIGAVNELNLAYEADIVIVCSPKLLDKETTVKYEDAIISQLMRYFGRHKIYRWNEFAYYFECDHKILGGTLYSNKKFLIITQGSSFWGWGNILYFFVNSIAYAKKRNLIPIIDMQHMHSQYQKSEENGVHNVFLDFFEPLNEYSLETVYKSQNVWLHGIYPSYQEESPSYADLLLKEEIREYIDSQYITMIPSERKVLGVVYRGTDYHIAYNHTRPMAISNFIDYVDSYRMKIGCDHVFLATEVEEVTIAFREYFGEDVSYVAQRRYSEKERRILCTIEAERENDEYLKGLEQLTVLELLSRCDSLLGMNCGFLRAAIMMNAGKYENVEVLK